jgi:phosphopantetheine--protein transferase-like protein
MENQLKETLSGFLKTDPASIHADTVIDRSALGNSILLHRMYARILEDGFEVHNYNDIRTFGDLITRINGKDKAPTQIIDNNFSKEKKAPAILKLNSNNLMLPIGIDIEDISNFDEAEDYREHIFYKSNFTPQEISYCLLQNNVRLSFVGLFAAKEAIVKANNDYQSNSFSAIQIEHDNKGKPYHKNFSISISHTNDTAIAVAVFNQSVDQDSTNPTKLSIPSSNNQTSFKGANYSLFAFLFALLALLVTVYLFFKRV